MTIYELPLFELFTRLRQADLPLGINEYILLLQALEAGFGVPDLEALARLCRTLWIKSDEERKLFDRHFEQIVVGNSNTKDAFRRYNELHRSKESAMNYSENTAKDTLDAEKKFVQAVLHHIASEDELPYNHFGRSDEYFPVTRRQMKQSWRHLRLPIREGPSIELDIARTVDEIGRQGLLLEPIFMPRRINRAELFLLIDQGGSMVPFHALSHRLTQTALRDGRLNNASVYYFRNSPIEHLFLDPFYEEDEPVLNVLHRLHHARTTVLIFSDAGAARGRFSQERYLITKAFLDQLRPAARYIVWLNPMPPVRWHGTTAEKIAQLIPMFDISRGGLDNAIGVLRGRFKPLTRAKAYL
jgi:uncharacterized protein